MVMVSDASEELSGEDLSTSGAKHGLSDATKIVFLSCGFEHPKRERCAEPWQNGANARKVADVETKTSVVRSPVLLS